MSQFTQSWVDAHNAKLEPVLAKKDGTEREGKLHEEISAYCKAKGWYVIHSRMDRPSTNGIGTPDFVIAADGGKVFFIEAKRRGAKPTQEQVAANYWLKKLGHEAHIVWSVEDFLAAVTPKTARDSA